MDSKEIRIKDAQLIIRNLNLPPDEVLPALEFDEKLTEDFWAATDYTEWRARYYNPTHEEIEAWAKDHKREMHFKKAVVI